MNLLELLSQTGRDPSRLVFEDELTGIYNRRFLHSYLEHQVDWKGAADFPLSVCSSDLDRFKEVNDTRGHDAGDQLLGWVASVLGEIAGKAGMPCRYGGDEFIILLPTTDRVGAQAAARRLIQRLRERPFRHRETGAAIPVSISIGVATAPDDATTSEGLLQAADAALYHAKRSGRDRLATATDVDPRAVFPSTAVRRLSFAGIAGRHDALHLAGDALGALDQGRSRFILFEGIEGRGKTTLLGAIARGLIGHDAFAVARVTGERAEGYHPYSLATRIVGALPAQRQDNGASVIEGLTQEETSHLAHILPQVRARGRSRAESDDRARRKRIFAVLARLLPRVIDGRPLVLIIDDLQFADEATLLVLRALLENAELKVLVCGALEPPAQSTGAAVAPFESVFGAGASEPPPWLRRMPLSPLSQEHIGEYLRSVFPGLRMPEGFDATLATITGGDPLFLGEIVRKLVADRKAALVGQDWVIEPIPPNYLPRSLDEIVQERIAALDVDTRRVLEHAAAIGESVPVSMLTGSGTIEESRVLEAVDQAAALGLVRTEFQNDDEVLRFLGKRIMGATYAGMDAARRTELHDQIGSHLEALQRERSTSSSPSVVAHHFRRGAQPEKAVRYEKAQRAYERSVFDTGEAGRYTLELVEEEDPRVALSSEREAAVPAVLRTFMSAARAVRLYPADSAKVSLALKELQGTLDVVLAAGRPLELSRTRNRLQANGRLVDVTNSSALATSFRELLDRFELQSLTFEHGYTEGELRQLLTCLAATKPAALGSGFWKRAVAEHGFKHVRPEQVLYSQIIRVRDNAPVLLPPREAEPNPEMMAAIPAILRALQSTAKVVKLYPADAKPVADAVEQLHAAVGPALREEALTLASVDHTLLANGVRVDASEPEAAKRVVELLDGGGLESVTFLPGVAATELAALSGAIREATPGTDRRFWETFARDRALAGLQVNQRRYVSGAHKVLREVMEAVSHAAAGTASAELPASESLTELQEALPALGKDLFATGEDEAVRALLGRLFEGFSGQDPASRARSVAACRKLFDEQSFGHQRSFGKVAAGPLLAVLETESAPTVLRDLGDLLRAMAADALRFDDYTLASRVLVGLAARRDALRQGSEGTGEHSAAAALDGRMNAASLRLLEDDIRSQETERQEQAAKVLCALEESGVRLLIDVIKSENELRVRQLAARLVAEAGPAGAAQIKRALVTEVLLEQRARLLDVIDTVTDDVRPELEHCLLDSSPRVRRAAFQLFERLRKDDLIELIVPFARRKGAVARAAIRALAPLRTSEAVAALSSILDTTRDRRLAALCCQALGASEHPAGIDALVRVLKAKRFFLWPRWQIEVRATAAAALKQIPHPRAAEMLARLGRLAQFAIQRLAVLELTEEQAVPVQSSRPRVSVVGKKDARVDDD